MRAPVSSNPRKSQVRSAGLVRFSRQVGQMAGSIRKIPSACMVPSQASACMRQLEPAPGREPSLQCFPGQGAFSALLLPGSCQGLP